MAGGVASMLVILLLKSLCEESLGAGGWTEVIKPDTPEYRALARYAYKDQKRYWSPRLTFLVTQARWKIVDGKEYNLAFIVLSGDLIIEKCLTIVFESPRIRGRPIRKQVTKFWCRSKSAT
uniref:Cystatin n=1 Tax=Rhipicephalus appendiculatus TaxID=34631 RepID=A0A131YGB1_RHIAP